MRKQYRLTGVIMKEQWITRLMQEHSESLLRFLSTHTDNREDAEDLLQ